MKKHIFLLTFFITMLVTNYAFAKPPLNENIIKYRYYVTTVSAMPEFQSDMVLKFEMDSSKKMIMHEAKKGVSNYDEILNFIDSKSTYEIVIYSEFLKEFKECLAAKGIFPSKFNDINITPNTIYTEVFDKYSLTTTLKTITTSIPENVKKTKRILPYLNATDKKKAYKEKLFKKDPYDEAIAKLDAGYFAYCNNNYLEAYNYMGASIPLWREFWMSHDYPDDEVKWGSGMLKLIQGSAAIDGNLYDQAIEAFKESAEYFNSSVENQKDVVYALSFFAEIYYRIGDVDSFVEFMDSLSKNESFMKRNYEYANVAMHTKFLTIVYEYYRLKDPINSYENNAELRTKINQFITSLENVANGGETPGGPGEASFLKKFIKRYRQIMNDNQVYIKNISFYSLINKKSNEYRYTLRDHNKLPGNDIFYPPDGVFILNNSSNHYSYISQPIAIVRKSGIRIYVELNVPYNNLNIIGQSTNPNMTFTCVNAGPGLITFESLTEVDDKLENYNLEILWTNNIVPIVKTKNLLSIVRQPINNPNGYYAKIVQHTCDFFDNFDSNDFSSDDKVMDAIWNGYTFNYLKNYLWFISEPNNDHLYLLLRNNYGGSYSWADFLIHSFACQGIEDNNETKFTKLAFYPKPIPNPNGSPIVPTFEFKTKIIGFPSNDNEHKAEFHAFVGYNGKYIPSPQYCFEGCIFDIVSGIKIQNTNKPLVVGGDSYMEYEFAAVKSINQAPLDPPTSPKQEKVREFMIFKK